MDAVRAINPEAGYSRMPGFPHEIWNSVYSDMRVWKWLLSHKKGGAGSKL
jgi:hypothetical protein